MKRTLSLLLLFVLIFIPAKAVDVQDVKPTKNVILFISDGTSLASISTARWLQWYTNPDKPKLNIDPYLCGTVRTHSSNAPIGDSAPTTSCYMSGQPSITGFVSTYPYACGKDDIYPVDPNRAYQPTMTVLEAAKIFKGASTGLVFTCEFPHATPADCSAHSYNRGKYEWIAPQMVHNDLDVVIGGGVSILTDDMESYLKENGYSVYRNNLKGMRADTNNKMWALYGDREMAYDLDRNPEEQPSIEEMTRTAIEKLSKNENGFFLMVEGSKVDWAAHANDPVGIATDFLAFDRAVGAALEFARQNGETTIIVTSDHGNSGISIGRESCKGYDKLTKDQLFAQLSRFELTAEGFAKTVNTIPNSEVQNLFREKAGFELSQEEMDALNNCKDYKFSPIPEAERHERSQASMYSNSLAGLMSQIITNRTCMGFTTHGHTGEDTFLASYHPQGTRPMGMLTNIELNHYMCSLYGFEPTFLSDMSNKYFARHTDVFKDYTCEIIPAKEGEVAPTLVVKNKKNKKKQLTIHAFTNIVKAGKKGDETIRLNSVIVYVDKNNTFYLPESLAEFLQ
ncbi:MAG TPA: alkaline phosphatase [Candidatus Parabacteroides intestinavium]|nr:alkaline phosphatase [Candidatus Parabacteroides intestinavium]